MRPNTENLTLISFGLPDTFPPSLLPDKARVFIRDTEKGMPADALLDMAAKRGFSPLWKPLPHMREKDVYGLGLDVDGLQVPLMAKMRRVSPARMASTPRKSAANRKQDSASRPEVDPRQMSLLD
jgi:hypothetical protein